MATSWAIVWNPSKGERDELEAQLELTPEQAERLKWYETDAEDAGLAAAKQAVADGCSLVLAAGGDGTVRVVAEALAGSDAELAIIPQGTGNLLARNVSVPLNKPADALAFALDHEPRATDVGWVEIIEGDNPGRYAFVVMAGLGVDAQLMAETDEDLKAKAGWLAYLEAVGRALQGASVVTATVGIDGADAEEMPAHTIMVGNCGSIQGGVTIFPDAEPDDGTLDVVVLNADSALGWFDTLKTMVWDNAIARLWTKEKPESATTTFQQAKELHIKLSEPVKFQIDGDEMGDVSELKVTVDPGALRLRW